MMSGSEAVTVHNIYSLWLSLLSSSLFACSNLYRYSCDLPVLSWINTGGNKPQTSDTISFLWPFFYTDKLLFLVLRWDTTKASKISFTEGWRGWCILGGGNRCQIESIKFKEMMSLLTTPPLFHSTSEFSLFHASLSMEYADRLSVVELCRHFQLIV